MRMGSYQYRLCPDLNRVDFDKEYTEKESLPYIQHSLEVGPFSFAGCMLYNEMHCQHDRYSCQ